VVPPKLAKYVIRKIIYKKVNETILPIKTWIILVPSPDPLIENPPITCLIPVGLVNFMQIRMRVIVIYFPRGLAVT